MPESIIEPLPPVYEELLATVPPPADSQIVDEVVDYEHDGLELEGYLAKDSAWEGKRPGILILHDWSGVGDNVRMRARMLARLGYVAFAADIYGKGVRPIGDAASAEAGKYYRQLPLLRERVRAGFEALLARPDVDPDRIVVIGYCFGGSAALEFARTGVEARGVASFHGALIAHDPSDAADIQASLLVMTGGSDPVVPDEAIAAFEDELRGAPEIDWQVVSYSGAPHAFTVPGPRYHALADKRSWRELLGFLDELLV